MENETRFATNEKNWAFRIYAILAALTGFVLASWGMVWLGTDLPDLPFYKASLIRVAGGVLMTAACLAWAMDRIDDPEVRRRALLWFGIGHALLFVVLLSQQISIWESPIADRVMTVVLITAFTFFYLWSGADLGPVPDGGLISIFRTPTQHPQDLRLRYQRQIRQAALQEERHRLARDLHDSVKQQIFAIQTSAAAAQVRFEADPAGARAALDQVRSSAREAMAEMEAMLHQLRAAPLENAGLVASLRQQCEALGFRTGATVDFDLASLPDNLALEPGAQDALFRAAQEALANIARHARASHVQVSLGSDSQDLRLTIEDNGAGFDSSGASGGMGLANMQARAAEFRGTFEINTSPGGGTRVTLAIPLTSSPTVADLNRRILGYGILVLGHFVIALWRHSSTFALFGVMWSVYCLRLVGARSAALQARREVVR